MNAYCNTNVASTWEASHAELVTTDLLTRFASTHQCPSSRPRGYDAGDRYPQVFIEQGGADPTVLAALDEDGGMDVRPGGGSSCAVIMDGPDEDKGRLCG